MNVEARIYGQTWPSAARRLPFAAFSRASASSFGSPSLHITIATFTLPASSSNFAAAASSQPVAAALAEEQDALEEVYEPFLIQIGFLDRTPRGRVATKLA